jgi:alkylhydroperoxidase/carboxymuconolactone decarboxylase family protein YurZ
MAVTAFLPTSLAQKQHALAAVLAADLRELVALAVLVAAVTKYLTAQERLKTESLILVAAAVHLGQEPQVLAVPA